MSAADAKPLSAVDDDDRYLLVSRTDILFLLNQLLRRGELFTVYFNQGRDFILTSILDVDAAHGLLIVDIGSDLAANQRLLRAERLVFVGAPDGIRIQFSVSGAQMTTFGEHEAFSCGLPGSVMKMQRREFFRVETPLRDPLRLLIPEGPSHQRETYPLRNLSVGGAAVEIDDPKRGFDTVQQYKDCQVDLRDAGRVRTDIEIKHITAVSLRTQRTQWTMGVVFINLSKVDQARLQRFLVYLERERRQLAL